MVSIPRSATVGDIWERVKEWPAEDRRSLAAKIVQSLTADSAGPGETKKDSLADLIGAWATASPPPSDEQVRQIIEDAILQKYGS